MKYEQQDNRVCMHYVTDRIMNILSLQQVQLIRYGLRMEMEREPGLHLQTY